MYKTVPSLYELPHNQDRLFAERIDSITSRELSPDNLVTYADTALDDLVVVVSDMVSAYASSPTIETQDTLQRERAAFSYFGFNADTVESTLDRIVDVSDSIKRLDSLVASKTKQVYGVIVPPDSRQMPEIQHGDGSLELPKPQIPKLNTLILLLEQHFGVDVDDNNQLSITSGIVPTEMMRAASYYLVEAPALSRAILVCDEIGNTTFVIDTEICRELGMTANEIGALTKDDIKDLIAADDRLGKQINYHVKGYVRDLADALSRPLTANMPTEHSDIRLLRPKAELAPEGYLAVKRIAKLYSSDPIAVKKAVTELGYVLGTVKEYRFGTRTVPGYSPEQIEMILEHIGVAELAPEGYLSTAGITTQYGPAAPTIQKAIAELADQLDEVKEYRFGTRTVPGYSPEQIEMILEHIGVAELAPEGYLSTGGITRRYSIDFHTIQKAIAELADQLDEVKKYRFGTTTVPGYSPEQIKIILEHIGTSELAPEGYLSAAGIAAQYSPAYSTTQKAIAELADQLDEVKKYRFGTTTVPGYSPEQIKIILEHIGTSELAPDGYLSIKKITAQYSLSFRTIQKATTKLAIQIGEVKVYRFGGHRTVPGYSPEQTEMILEWIRTNTKSKLGSTSLAAVDADVS